MPECAVCGKQVDEDETVEKEGETFCCENHEEQYFDEEQEDDAEVCEFC